ncbi:MAG: hypothetical protein GX620_13605 [Chloroflexi bacterium]|nr:hypothetical protein [Chloroflexota bacterium]
MTGGWRAQPVSTDLARSLSGYFPRPNEYWMTPLEHVSTQLPHSTHSVCSIDLLLTIELTFNVREAR